MWRFKLCGTTNYRKGPPMRTAEFRQCLAAATLAATQPMRSPKDEIFIPYKKLKTEHGIDYSRVHLRRLIARRLFPAPVMLSPNRCAWRLSALAAWKASRPIAPIPSEAA